MSNTNVDYGIKDIKTLEGMEAVRLRPGMFVGSVGLEGVLHITKEIISNVIDEYLNGHCTECSIHIEGDSIGVRDNGRGVPFGKAEDGSETLVNVYTKLHTGAKFDSSGKTGYNTSGGMNGVGAKATNALSKSFCVKSIRDGKMATAKFERGQLISYREENVRTLSTGTQVDFIPDPEIFKEGTKIDYNTLKKLVQELAYLSPGLLFNLWYDGKEETITSQNGIKDYMNDLNANKNTLTSMFYTETMEDRIGVKVAMQYNDTYSDIYKLYTNSIPNSGGTHLTGFRTALTQTVNKYARDNKYLKEKDANLTGDELKEGLTLVLSFVMPDPVFSGQTKDVLSSSEARTMVQRLVSKEIEVWLNSNKKDAKAIIDKALLARAAREKAKQAKDAIRDGKEKKKRKVINPDKLKDAENLGQDSILLTVEGNSAAASMAVARDTSKYGILGLRGKPLNLLTNNQEKANKNEEIQLLISALGITPGAYNSKDLRYGRLAIASDSDSDGYHIGLLIASALTVLCPEFIQEGRLCWLRSPLYILKQGKTEKYYYSDEELAAASDLKGELQRCKGLGALSAEQAKNSMFTDQYQRLDVLEYTPEAINKLKTLMGEAVGPRKTFIFNNIDFSEVKE